MPSSPVIVSNILLVFLSLLLSCTTSEFSFSDFLECLPNHSQPSTSISETIYTPQNTSFQLILHSYIANRRFATPTTPKPLAIVAAKHASHVQATVVCAQQHGVQLRIRSGGHDYEGLSHVSDVPFVILDMFNLRSIEINVAEESAWVESGATVGELYYKIAEKSKVLGFPAGVCPTIGVGGHFSGGGYGALMRKYGLTVDNIEDAKLVDVNGAILDRKSMGEDLFWAIRGGGGASFGVILSWKIKLVSVPDKVTVFHVKKTIEEGVTNLMYRWQYVAPELPKEVFIRAMPEVSNNSREGNKTVKVSFIGQYLGESQKLLPLMNEKFPELGLQLKDCLETSWVESVLSFAGFPNGTSIDVLLKRPNGPGIFFKSKNDYVKQPIPKEGLESLWKMMIEIEDMWMQWNPYGGRMSEISESETPFPHRAGNLFMLHYFVSWKKEGIEATNKHIALSRKLYQLMTPFVSNRPREAFQNYRDLDIGANRHNQNDFGIARVYGSKYFKGNFDRLVRVKTAVDPRNFFRHEQSIPPL